MAYCNPEYFASLATRSFYDISWNDYVNEINNGRPVLLNVDADGDGLAEHFATAVGYDDATMEYAIYNTWDHDLHWYSWHSEGGFEPYGIYGVWFVNIFTGGNVIHVPEDYSTIQAGINAAESGDTILVSDGVYTGAGNSNIYFYGKSVVVISENGPEYTVLDGLSSPSYIAFRVLDNNNLYTEISGFTFKNWNASDGAIYMLNSSITVSNCIFTKNANQNGAIYCRGYYCNPLIKGSTVAGNTGGGLHANFSAVPTVKNTIIFENELYEALASNSGQITMSYSIVRGGYPGTENVLENPMLIDVYGGDLNVFANSPCINGGDPADTDPDGTRADIGAFFGFHPGYFDNGELIYVDRANGSVDGPGTEESPFAGIGPALKISRHGDTVLVMPGIYDETLDYKGHNAIVASRFLHSGDTADINNTRLIGPGNSFLVNYESYETNTATLMGFTLTGGYAENGGAIYCGQSDPTIAFNYIRDNVALYYGGGLYFVNSNAVLIGNLICDNSAGWFGGGVYAAFSDLRIEGCTITRNSGSEMSGGLYAWHADLEMLNTILWGNIAPYMIDLYSYAGECDATWCDIGGIGSGEGNMDCDPMFCDADNSDFSLNGASPCLGGGLDGDNVGAFGFGCGEMKTVMVPDSLHIKYADLVEPMIVEVYLGNFFGDYTAADINPSSLTVNDTILPQTTELLENYSGFVGEVWKADIAVKGFIEGYGLIWGTVELPYVVAGEWDDGEPFEVSGTVKITGHKAGDLNYDGQVNVLDIMFLVDYKFRAGPPPEPLEAADFDCDERVNVLDVLYLIDFEYRDGPEPMSECE